MKNWILVFEYSIQMNSNSMFVYIFHFNLNSSYQCWFFTFLRKFIKFKMIQKRLKLIAFEVINFNINKIIFKSLIEHITHWMNDVRIKYEWNIARVRFRFECFRKKWKSECLFTKIFDREIYENILSDLKKNAQNVEIWSIFRMHEARYQKHNQNIYNIFATSLNIVKFLIQFFDYIIEHNRFSFNFLIIILNIIKFSIFKSWLIDFNHFHHLFSSILFFRNFVDIDCHYSFCRYHFFSFVIAKSSNSFITINFHVIYHNRKKRICVNQHNHDCKKRIRVNS